MVVLTQGEEPITFCLRGGKYSDYIFMLRLSKLTPRPQIVLNNTKALV